MSASFELLTVSFNLLNEVKWKVGLRPGPAGNFVCEKTFLTFLARPLNPHATWFELEGEVSTPHFKVAGLPTHWFPRVYASVLKRFVDKFGEVAHRRFVESLQPVDLAELERNGWTVHSPNLHVIARGMRGAARRRSFAVTPRSLEGFVAHVLRHRGLPTGLDTLPKDISYRVLATRRVQGRELQVRGLFFFPGEGWFWHRMDWLPPDAVESVFPVETLRRKLFEPVRRMLKRAPRRKKSSLDELEHLPGFVSQVVGFYLSDLLNVALHEAIAAADTSLS